MARGGGPGARPGHAASGPSPAASRCCARTSPSSSSYVTAKATTYSLNTNGTLITPQIARLLRRKGSKMVAVYGATAEVYDHVTRNPGGFEALLQGLAYLKEAGAGFTVQLIPMRDNWHAVGRRWWRSRSRGASTGGSARRGSIKSACGDARAQRRDRAASGSTRPTSSSSTSPTWPTRSARPTRGRTGARRGRGRRRPRLRRAASPAAATSTSTPTAA